MSTQDTHRSSASLMTLQGMADHLDVSERTIRNWITRGYFNAYKVRGRRGYFVRPSEVSAALKEHATSGAMRTGTTAFGPKGKVVTIDAEVVE
ncbi:helix-turn-helix domain-containing protein [Demequina sp. NBRC 110051]|uniref:helix-turn-helix domain-containing protein n=1 Tax=Demequina sp. NBRC 110051 TaxID=1570340 RepID=UPI000A06F94A|nr:helix-turn-helix domain-containing protein [Demequina sp. NBRC 110051]